MYYCSDVHGPKQMELNYFELNTCMFSRSYMHARTWFYIHVHVNYIRVLQDAHVLSPVFIDKD